MKIDGKLLQHAILVDVAFDIAELKQKGIVPCIAIVTLGPEDSWQAYVNQKIKLASHLGIKTRLINLNPKNTGEVIAIVKELNIDSSVHGLIVQRPFPTHIDTEKIIQGVSSKKDIDGFISDSEFDVPAWLAVKHILTHISFVLNNSDLKKMLSNQSVLVVGKGGTAGLPVINGLKKLGIEPIIIDSKTENRKDLFKKADIIITAVGKSNIIPIEILKEKSILIGIGIHSEHGKIRGDFDQKLAETKHIIYTPTPGGVGPINLAYLFKNLLTATRKQAV